MAERLSQQHLDGALPVLRDRRPEAPVARHSGRLRAATHWLSAGPYTHPAVFFRRWIATSFRFSCRSRLILPSGKPATPWRLPKSCCAKIRGVSDSHWTIGEGAPRTYYNVVSANDGVSSFAAAWVDTTSPEDTRALLPDLQARLSAALPDAQILALPFEQGPPFEAPIEIRVIGPDLGALRDVSDQLRLLLTELEDVTYTSATISAAEPKLVFYPEENATAAAGMRTGDLPTRLNDSLMGVFAGTVQEGNTELNVRVRSSNAHRDEVHELTALPLVSKPGRHGAPGAARQMASGALRVRHPALSG